MGNLVHGHGGRSRKNKWRNHINNEQSKINALKTKLKKLELPIKDASEEIEGLKKQLSILSKKHAQLIDKQEFLSEKYSDLINQDFVQNIKLKKIQEKEEKLQKQISRQDKLSEKLKKYLDNYNEYQVNKTMTQEEVLNKIMQLASKGAKVEDKQLSEMVSKLKSIDAEFVYSILQKGNLEVVRALFEVNIDLSEDLYNKVLNLAADNNDHSSFKKLQSLNVENNYSEYEESVMSMNDVHVMGDNNSLNDGLDQFIDMT